MTKICTLNLGSKFLSQGSPIVIAFKNGLPSKIYLIVLALCYTLLLPAGKVDAQAVGEVKDLRIDLGAAQEMEAAGVFDEVNYIPLETRPESVFGEISRMYVTAEYFIIYDEDTASILLFFKNGRFHSKILTKGNVSKFFLDQTRNEIIFRTGNTLNFYSYQGKKLRSRLLERNYLNAEYCYFPDGISAVSLYAVSEKFLPDTLSHEVILRDQGKTFAEFLPYNMKRAPVQSDDFEPTDAPPFFPTDIDTCFNYSHTYDYSIYELSPHSFRKKYAFTFPLVNSIPAGFTTDTLLKGNRKEYFLKHRTRISSITHTYQFGSSLFFKPWNWNDRGNSYLYNVHSGNLVSIRGIQPDSLSCLLPVTDLASDVDFSNRNFLASDGTYIYTCLSSELLISSARANGKSKVHYSEQLRAYLDRADRKDNPVIVEIKPKKDF